MRPRQHSRLARHGAFWAVALGLSVLIQLPAHFLAGVPLSVGSLFFVQLPASLLAIYPLLYGVLPRLLRGQVGLAGLLLAAWLVASVLVVNGLRGLYALGPAPGWFGEAAPAAMRWSNYHDLDYAWFVLLTTAGAAGTIRTLNSWHELERLGRQLEQRRLHAELELLKAQLQPPFLFDTLRTLHALTASKSAAAPGAVLHLAELLRYLLYDSARAAVPLADEVDMLRHYLGLEVLRLGPRVEVTLQCNGAVAGATIAPLLLLPLLENAVRHGTGPQQECPWLSIDLVARPHSLTVKVINSRPAGPPDWQAGAGLRTLRERLHRLYPNRHELKLVAEPDSFLAALHLQLEPT